mgnify:FL=1
MSGKDAVCGIKAADEAFVDVSPSGGPGGRSVTAVGAVLKL